MILTSAVILTLQLQFDRPEFPNTELRLQQSASSAEHQQWVAGQRGFTAHEPFGLALTPSSGEALSFALREYNANCLHNGNIELPGDLEIGALKPGQEVSANYQLHAQTCSYAAYDWQGNVQIKVIGRETSEHAPDLTMVPQPLHDAPWQPQPPQAQARPTMYQPDQQEYPTTYGWAQSDSDGQLLVHYSSQPWLAVPAYSLSKTFIAANAAMLLEKQSDTPLLTQTMNTWGTVCEGETWQSVSLRDALNMRTGHFMDRGYGKDEAAEATVNNFFTPSSHADKLKHACSYKAQAEHPIPMVYQSSSTYLLATALQNYLKQQQQGRLDELLYEHIWQPLELSPLAYSIDTTKDDRQQVWGGYGLSLLPHDLVKLAHFIQHDPMNLGFSDILGQPEQAHPVPGHSNLRYRDSIWFWQHPESEKWYPFLSGYGGIIVLFLDPHHIYYLVSDQHDYRFASIIESFQNHKK
ncbi:serine hydrolase [Pseudidiomarina insulisalsae]|uniref:Uncharacterized protein n=1 Tax=Pseudidiomarina insulisalsae TaxID=575789 RepID=A0A432YLE5_9GAMM|nr:serine hydrolase [Pseudidiomarina insulisalsae]RUO61809.1 hypothetical protein CWI71_05460 [Pseudidiomarina insulisalsae]